MDVRVGTSKTPAELNSILQNHVVRNRDGCALTTFGCVEWESQAELYIGVMRARCYLWNMPKHRFHKMNPQLMAKRSQETRRRREAGRRGDE